MKALRVAVLNRWLPIILKIVRQTDGRDKVLKVIQYLAKIIVLTLQNKTLAYKRLQAIASSFSTTRKVIRLGHFLEPLDELRQSSSGEFLADLNQGMGVLNDISDDIVCLAKIGVLSKETGSQYEFYSNYLWLFCTMIDLGDQRKAYRSILDKIKKDGTSKELEEKLLMCRVSTVKLLGDFMFCLYDVLEFTAAPRGQAVCGWISAIMGLYKLYYKSMK